MLLIVRAKRVPPQGEIRRPQPLVSYLRRLPGGKLLGVDQPRVSQIPGIDRWSYGAFRQDHETESITVPVVRDDGESAEFTVPKFVEDPEDLRGIASVVIAAFEKWEAVQGLGG